MWVWVNTHGSFPLGLVRARAARRSGAGSTASRPAASSGSSPGGRRAPPSARSTRSGPGCCCSRSSVLRKQRGVPGDRGVAAAPARRRVAGPVRRPGAAGRRPAAPAAGRGGSRCPLVVFAGLALMSARNVAVASLVARCRAWPRARPGSARSTVCAARGPRSAASPCAWSPAACSRCRALHGPRRPARRLPGGRRSPGSTDQGRLDDRVVAPDFVGNYLEARYGARRSRLHRRPGRHVPGGGRRRLAASCSGPKPGLVRACSTATRPASSSGRRTSPSPRSSERSAAGSPSTKTPTGRSSNPS